MAKIKLFTILIVITMLFVAAGSVFAEGEANASYQEHVGVLTVTPSGTSYTEALAAEDDKFVQLAPGAYVVMKFADDAAAQPDGTDAPDLRIATVDNLYPAEAEILTSVDGNKWTSLGVFADTSNLDINLAVPALYVKFSQAQHYIDPEYPEYGFDLDAVTALNQELVRYAEITSPAEGANVTGIVPFTAQLHNDDQNDGVQWAVRFGTCAANTGTVMGNVDGFTNSYDWDGEFFSAEADTSTWEPGTYCFIFNPRERNGEQDVRETRLFTVGEPEEEVFCDIGWKPPIKLEAHDVNVKATLPIKFYLEDCNGSPMRMDAEPELVVKFLGSDDLDEQTFDLAWKKGTGGYLYLALFRPLYPGKYLAIVTYDGQDYEQPFEVVEHGKGKDKQQSEDKLTGKDKNNAGKPEVANQDNKPKGKPEDKPGKGKGPKKP